MEVTQVTPMEVTQVTPVEVTQVIPMEVIPMEVIPMEVIPMEGEAAPRVAKEAASKGSNFLISNKVTTYRMMKIPHFLSNPRRNAGVFYFFFFFSFPLPQG